MMIRMDKKWSKSYVNPWKFVIIQLELAWPKIELETIYVIIKRWMNSRRIILGFWPTI